MANKVSKLKFNNVTYDLADESSRAAINNLEGQLEATRVDLNNMRAAVGSPLTAATTSAMTDTSKIYVYTGTTTTVSSVTFTAGNWYYHDGTKWQLGGVYNETALETDTTLTVSGAAADAKVTGDKVTDLKNAITSLDDNICEAYIPHTWSATFVQGGIRANGTNLTSTNRVRNDLYHIVQGNGWVRLVIPTGYKASVFIYSSRSASAFSYSVGFLSEGTHTLKIPKGYSLRFVVAFATDADITPEDVAGFTWYEYYLTDTSLSQAGKAADALTTGEAIDNLYTELLEIKRNAFIKGAKINSDGSLADDTASCCTTNFAFPYPVKIISTDDNVRFRVHDGTSWVGETTSEGKYTSFNRIMVTTLDESECTGTEVDAIMVYTIYAGKEYYVDTYIRCINTTQRIGPYDENGVARFRMLTDSPNVGMLQRNQTIYRANTKPFLCKESNCIVICGQYNTNYIDIVIDNILVATLTNGEWYTVPKNTMFICGFRNSTTVNTEPYQNSNILAVANGNNVNDVQITQPLTTTSSPRGIQSVFAVNNDIYCLSQNGNYSVKKGVEWVVNDQFCGSDLGHANSCNYDSINNVVYVSELMPDPKNIYVLSVDISNRTLTYIRTIQIPISTDYNIAQYYVFDDERQVFFLGQKTGANYRSYGLFIKNSDSYELSWERNTLREGLLQAMTVQGNYLYYAVVDETTSKTKSINRINMANGELEWCDYADMTSAMFNYEAEGIIPVGNDEFIIVAAGGRTFFTNFVKQERI